VKPLSDEAVARLAELASKPEVPGGRYDVLEKVGAGGMSTVYRARDRQLEREVAIKVVRDERRPGDLAQRLRQEARILAALEHPSIPPVHEIGELADGRAYCVLRFVRGTTLARAELGPPNARLRLFLRLCEAVAYAHGRGVVHRDLKPDNVMLGPLGELYVMDWGIAGALDRTDPGAGGTPGFSAPEQEAGAGGAVDARADVYALAGLLAFLASGRAPGADGALALEDLPRPLAAVIARGRERDPARRQPSALELARDVAAFLDQEPVSAYREGPLERAGRFLSKHRFVAWLVVGYLVLRALVFFLYRR